MLPQILDEFGFLGALHATLDDGRFPSRKSKPHPLGRARRHGDGGGRARSRRRRPRRRLPPPARPPRRRPRPRHQTPPSSWPIGRAGRVPGWTTCGGSPRTRRSWATSPRSASASNRRPMSGQTTQYTPDQYRSPYLKQAVAAGQRDPISRWTRRFQRRAVADAADTMAVMAQLASAGAEPHASIFRLGGTGVSPVSPRNTGKTPGRESAPPHRRRGRGGGGRCGLGQPTPRPPRRRP